MFSGLKSIRARLTFWYSLLLLSTLVAFGLIAYTYSRQKLTDSLDISLSNEVQWVKGFIEPKAAKVRPSKKFTMKKKNSKIDPITEEIPEDSIEMSQADEDIWNQIYEHALLNPKKTLIEVTDKKGNVIFRSFTVGEDSLPVNPAPLNTIQINTIKNERGENLRVASTSTKTNHIYVAYPLDELREVLENLFAIFLVLVPIALAISIGGGWFFAYSSLRPVDNITKTVQKITAHNLDQQIPKRSVNDEIGRLISTFNGMIVRLRQSFDQIKQFSLDASHELRTPLTIMRGEIELSLRNPKEGEEYRRVLASMLEEVIRLSTIIDNLLTLAKADHAQPEILFREHVNLNELLKELFEDSEMLALKKNISIKLIEKDQSVVNGDRVRLRQLMLNLVDNAIKFTPENGNVTLSLENENGFAVMSVKDNGVGIPVNEQKKIFDRFYRVDKARSRELGGSGLGLSIAKWIAELHKGKITVESEENTGSKFNVFIPLFSENVV
ncbi:MAG: HAMP domain-containing protein [Ignavibacteriales bacterium]|nr:HAMP domain-containing protein [Ignavibacteriales bacterium]